MRGIGAVGVGGFGPSTRLRAGIMGEGTGICDNGANGGCGGTFGAGATVLTVSGVISVMVLIGSGLGGGAGIALFSPP